MSIYDELSNDDKIHTVKVKANITVTFLLITNLPNEEITADQVIENLWEHIEDDFDLNTFSIKEN